MNVPKPQPTNSTTLPIMKSMMQKKYLLVSLLAAAALLSGCSSPSAPSQLRPSDAVAGTTAEGVNNGSGADGTGVVNPSKTKEERISTETLEEAAVDVVVLPNAVTSSPDYVKVPLGEVSGSLIDNEQETVAVYNTYKGPEIRQWVKDLTSKGWSVSQADTVDNATTYNVLLSKDSKIIALYANNTDANKNTLISFSK